MILMKKVNLRQQMDLPRKKGEHKNNPDTSNADSNNKFDLKDAFAQAFKELEDWN